MRYHVPLSVCDPDGKVFVARVTRYPNSVIIHLPEHEFFKPHYGKKTAPFVTANGAINLPVRVVEYRSAVDTLTEWVEAAMLMGMAREKSTDENHDSGIHDRLDSGGTPEQATEGDPPEAVGEDGPPIRTRRKRSKPAEGPTERKPSSEIVVDEIGDQEPGPEG